MEIKNILVVGDHYGRTRQCISVMQRLGHFVDVLNCTPDNFKEGVNEHVLFYDRVWNKLGFPRDRVNLNNRVLEVINQKKYDFLRVEKCLISKTKTLKKIKKIFPT